MVLCEHIIFSIIATIILAILIPVIFLLYRQMIFYEDVGLNKNSLQFHLQFQKIDSEEKLKKLLNEYDEGDSSQQLIINIKQLSCKIKFIQELSDKIEHDTYFRLDYDFED